MAENGKQVKLAYQIDNNEVKGWAEHKNGEVERVN